MRAVERANSPAEASRTAAIVVSVVVNASQTEAVLFGPDGCADSMPPGAVFVSSATMAPDAARELASRLEASGRLYLDAPMSGGAQRAAGGELTVLASGSAAAFAAARPVLDAMAVKVYELGDEAGIGASFKSSISCWQAFILPPRVRQLYSPRGSVWTSTRFMR